MSNVNIAPRRGRPAPANTPAHDAAPIVAYFSPWTDPRPCWFCHHYDGMVNAGSAARCVRGMALRICAQPDYGCAFWEREPGADDELDWSPQGGVQAARQDQASNLIRGA